MKSLQIGGNRVTSIIEERMETMEITKILRMSILVLELKISNFITLEHNSKEPIFTHKSLAF